MCHMRRHLRCRCVIPFTHEPQRNLRVSIWPWLHRGLLLAPAAGVHRVECRLLLYFFPSFNNFFSLRPFTPFAYLSHLFVVSPLFVLGLRSLHTINRSIDIFQLNSVIANRWFYTHLIGHVSYSELLVIDRNWLECCARRNVYNLRLHGC